MKRIRLVNWLHAENVTRTLQYQVASTVFTQLFTESFIDGDLHLFNDTDSVRVCSMCAVANGASSWPTNAARGILVAINRQRLLLSSPGRDVLGICDCVSCRPVYFLYFRRLSTSPSSPDPHLNDIL